MGELACWENLSRTNCRYRVFCVFVWGWEGVLPLLPLQLGFCTSDVPSFQAGPAGPWRVARETTGQLQRWSAGEWVTQVAFFHTQQPLPNIREKIVETLYTWSGHRRPWINLSLV